ncbi:MAG: PD40 domain-containing protein [Ardenticatenaceae bacterium]|nr:PD40 domain-containing protein [Ardenticatenaceae bacterium]MCB9443332.1 PD40 domain-containing protein [Ardenticatenaceae bacterium]
MKIRYWKWGLVLAVAFSFFVFISLRDIKQTNQEQAVADIRGTAVHQITEDAAQRMREALSANIAARALALSREDEDVAMLMAVEALNVLRKTDTIPHATEHAIWQTLANGTVQILDGPGQSPPPSSGQLLSPDEKWRAAYTESDNIVTLWNLTVNNDSNTPNPIQLAEHKDNVTGLAFSPDGKWLATASTDDTAVLYNLDQDNPARSPIILDKHTNDVTAVAFSDDGRWLATGSADHSLLLYPLTWSDFQDRANVLQWLEASDDTSGQDGHRGPVTAVTFSPNSRWLASASTDKTVRLWSLDDDPQQYGITLDGPDGNINQLVFSPESMWLTATNSENQSYLWNLSATALIERACTKVGRNLTQSEWSLHLPEFGYHKTCNQY